MALGLAQSAIKDGREAAVFLNVDAPIFAAKDLGDDIKFADFPPIKKMLADFVAQGGRVLVCGHCAHIVKLEQGNIIDGAKVLAHKRTLRHDAARYSCFLLLTVNQRSKGYLLNDHFASPSRILNNNIEDNFTNLKFNGIIQSYSLFRITH